MHADQGKVTSEKGLIAGRKKPGSALPYDFAQGDGEGAQWGS